MRRRQLLAPLDVMVPVLATTAVDYTAGTNTRSVPRNTARRGALLERLIDAVRRSPPAPRLNPSGEPASTTDTFTLDVLDATGCLVIVIEPGSGVVAAMNKAALDVTGHSRADVVGRPLDTALMSLVDAERVKALHSHHTEGSLEAPFEAPLLTKTGVERRIVWSSTLLHGRPGATTYVVMSGLDMSADSTHGGLVSHLLRASAEACSVGTDHQGRVILWSEGAEQLLGYSRLDMMGSTLPLALFDQPQLQERAAQAGIPADLRVLAVDTEQFESRAGTQVDLGLLDRRGSTPEQGTRGTSYVPTGRDGTLWTLICKDGTRVTLATTVKAIRSSNGKQVGFLGVGTDVTAQQRTHHLLVSALRRESHVSHRLRELDEGKDRLIATVSHELRTPLTSIDGYTELLEDGLGGELTQQQRKHIDAIRRNTHRLSRLVDDLLTLSGIQAGTLQSALEELDLRDPVRQAWAELELTCASRGLSTSLELPPSPVMVRGDVAYLARTISSLLTNSAKCTGDEGSVSCVLVTNGDEASVKVTDTGFGIPIHEQSSLFTRFFRTSTAQEREIQGAGLGLAIAAAVVHSCGGRISVASEHLRGATFTIDLPLADSHQRTP